MQIRPAEPRDAQIVRTFLEGLSEDSRWLRYHSPAPIVRSWMVDSVVCNDHTQREALLALHGDRVVGIAEWGREAPGAKEAHVAIVVDDSFRRRGVARELMGHLAANGLAHGVESFAASVLSVNRPTMALIQRVAPRRTTTFDGPVVEVRIPLSVSA
jgi:GNAT superfamily N-acetyltransferase